MWTDTTRVQYAREHLTLPSDLTDAEWAVLKPFLPAPSHVGRPRKWPLRRIIEAILYLLRGGLPWRMLPPCFPPVSTVRRWFYLWRDNGLWVSLNHALLLIGREAEGREASPSADGGYAGNKLRQALCKIGKWRVEVIKRSDTAKSFEVLPRRWVVERTFAWLSRLLQFL